MVFRNILVAVDGSEHSQRAAALAGDLASHYSSNVTLLHVVHDPRGEPPRGLEDYEALEGVQVTERDLIESAGSRILEDAERVARHAGAHDVKPLLHYGRPADAIIEFSKNSLFPGDAVIMGRRGRGDLAGLLLGSVSHEVARAAESTVITVE